MCHPASPAPVPGRTWPDMQLCFGPWSRDLLRGNDLPGVTTQPPQPLHFNRLESNSSNLGHLWIGLEIEYNLAG